MTGPLAKADALLAARLAPWLELLAHKAPTGAGEQAQPVTRASQVDNDVLLPARAGLHPQAGTPVRPAALPAAAPSAPAGGAALSTAGRVILALESGVHANQASPVRGGSALWAAGRQAPATDAIASALSRQVSDSGLFYEAHLAEFATGARSLAQMQREPQANLAMALAAQGDEPQAPMQQRQLAGMQLPAAPAQAPAIAVPASAGSAMAALTPASQMHPQARQQPDEARVHDVQRAEPAEPRAVRQHDMAAPAQASAADAPASAAVIHPQAAALVHQQLDLLASSMFRWSGEAWPGVPMEWSVKEEGARQHAGEGAEDQPHWSTTLSLDLPRLGPVKVDLRLDGSNVHAQLSAAQAAAQGQLRSHGNGLSVRMSGAGLCLKSFQLGSGAAA